MTVDADAEARRQLVDRPLEPVVVEGDEPPALLADKMVVVVAVGQNPLEPGLPIPHRDPLDEPVLGEQVKHAVDARPPGSAPLGRAKRILDLDHAQRARLRRQQVDHPVAGTAALEPGAREHIVNVLVPVSRGHHEQD